LDTNIIALRPAVRIHVFPKHDDLLPQHAKWLLGINIQGALNAIHVRKTTSVRVPSDYTNIHVTSPNRRKTKRMSAVMVFGGRPIYCGVIIVVEKVRPGALIVSGWCFTDGYDREYQAR
jgi:hypothetical protein